MADKRPVGQEKYAPILPGAASSDYERYLETESLLALQKDESARVHRDELLFQVTHQASELWLKLGVAEMRDAVALLESDRLRPATRLLGRAALVLRLVIAQLDMLERMSPWEYQEIRKVLGHGSGFDSPGWRQFRHALPPLGAQLDRLLRERGLTPRDLYVEAVDHGDLYDLAEAVLEVDELAQLWRMRHFQVVSRIIGDRVVGTQGTPVELIGRLVTNRSFSHLWDARNQLTALSQAGAG